MKIQFRLSKRLLCDVTLACAPYTCVHLPAGVIGKDWRAWTTGATGMVFALLYVMMPSLQHRRLTTFPLIFYVTSAQVAETSVTNNSSFQNYSHPDDHTIRTTETPGFNHLLHLLGTVF